MGRGSSNGTQATGLHPRASSVEEARIVEEIRDRLGRCWSRETSADPENWSAENPSYGQCAVSSMLLQDVAGGDLMRTTVDGVSHYFNCLPSGRAVDLTFEQFPDGSSYDEEPVVRERSYVESHEPTMERYRSLREEAFSG